MIHPSGLLMLLKQLRELEMHETYPKAVFFSMPRALSLSQYLLLERQP
jgi:hypothetical protein